MILTSGIRDCGSVDPSGPAGDARAHYTL